MHRNDEEDRGHDERAPLSSGTVPEADGEQGDREAEHALAEREGREDHGREGGVPREDGRLRAEHVPEVVGRMAPDQHRREYEERKGRAQKTDEQHEGGVLDPPELSKQVRGHSEPRFPDGQRRRSGVSRSEERDRVIELQGGHAGSEIPGEAGMDVGLVFGGLGSDHASRADEVSEPELESGTAQSGSARVRRLRRDVQEVELGRAARRPRPR